jgi:hypothetical protein
LHLLESTLAIAFCAAGTAAIVVGNRQSKMRDINRIPIVSPRAKHVIGILLILVAILVFLSQFIVGTRKARPRQPLFRATELDGHCVIDVMRSRRGCPTLSG